MICPLDVGWDAEGVNSEQMISSAEMERMMKVQEVILKAMAGSLKWWEAAEIIGVSDLTMRRAPVASPQSSIPRPSDFSVAARWNRTFYFVIKTDNFTKQKKRSPPGPYNAFSGPP